MNLSGTLNAWRAVMTPRLIRPHVVLPQFSDLTFPLSKCVAANVQRRWGIQVQPDIRAVVIDKDNCIAKAKSLDLVEEYMDTWNQLLDQFGKDGVLLVSNTSGAAGETTQATYLEKTLKIPVLRHDTKKPGCHREVVKYFLDQNPPKISHPSQIAVIGDRLFMDVMLGNLMGSWAIWLQRGVEQGKDPARAAIMQLTYLEKTVYNTQNTLGIKPRFPSLSQSKA